MINKFKRNFLKVGQKEGQRTTDDDFDEKVPNQTELYANYQHLKTDLISSAQHVTNAVASIEKIEGALLSCVPSDSTNAQGISGLHKLSQDLVVATQDVVIKDMQEGDLVVLQRKCETGEEFKKRLLLREEARSKMDYYRAKIEEIRKEQAKLAGQGKQETPKEKERFTRNENNLQTFTTSFNKLNQELKLEMEQTWASRHGSMELILKAIETDEAMLVAVLSSNLQKSNFLLPSPSSSWAELMNLD
jgi:hypothetical protein